MVKKNIILAMVEQHRGLQKRVGVVLQELQENSIDIAKISQGLKQFNQDLAEHLKLENEVFYINLLKDMKNSGQDITQTEQFIAEMEGIGKAVGLFLKKYDTPTKVKEQIEEFKLEMPGIGNALNLRIESEEAGVYGYWGLF